MVYLRLDCQSPVDRYPNEDHRNMKSTWLVYLRLDCQSPVDRYPNEDHRNMKATRLVCCHTAAISEKAT